MLSTLRYISQICIAFCKTHLNLTGLITLMTCHWCVTGWLQVGGWAASKQILQGGGGGIEKGVPYDSLGQTPQKTVSSWKTFLLYLTFLFFLSPSTPLFASAIQAIMPSHMQICSYRPLWTPPMNNQGIFPLSLSPYLKVWMKAPPLTRSS